VCCSRWYTQQTLCFEELKRERHVLDIIVLTLLVNVCPSSISSYDTDQDKIWYERLRIFFLISLL